MLEFKMLIDGKLVDAESGKTCTAVNPATEEEIAKFPMADKNDVEKAVAAAKKAYPAWSKMPVMERGMLMSKAADIVQTITQDLGKLEIMDHGFPLNYGMQQGSMAAFGLRGAIGRVRTLYGDTGAPRRTNALVYTQWEPIGPFALITPWNLPLMMVLSKLGPCIAMGNTCVIKPPTIDSLSTLKLAEALAQSPLPPGVVNVITGPGSTVGEQLAAHPDIWGIGFTGSSETGKRIMELGSRNVKRMDLELGGKNPFIVFEDAEMETAVETGLRACMRNCGQVCAAPGRFYIHEKIYDEYLSRFVDAASKLRVGNGMDPKTQMGPVVSREHRDKIENYIQGAVKQGAKVILGGERPTAPPYDKGFWVMPTVITGVTQEMTIAREEVFGPVAIFMQPFSSEQQVIDWANDNRYGLCCNIFTKDTGRAIRVGNQMECGDVWINEHQLAEGMSWGGFKESGVGKGGIKSYAQQKDIYVDLTEMKHRPWNEM